MHRLNLPGVRKNVPLAPHTTFRIGGKAEYFFEAKTKEDIAKALKAAKEAKLPVFVLGGGSNLLVSDKGFKGLVIKIQNTKYKIESTKMYAEAGVCMPDLVKITAQKGLKGLEWAGGLPGTLGGAVRGNAGAFGGEMKDSVLAVECIDHKGNFRKFSNKASKFSYRSSLFKKKNWVVVASTLKLSKGKAKNLWAIAKDHIRYRKERHPLEFPNAGSIFKNCDLKKIPRKLLPSVQAAVKNDPFPVVPTAFLIAKAQLKGLRHKDAQVSEKHPNFIINRGGARATHVLSLMQKVKKTIKKKFSVDLEEEIQHVG